MSFGQWRRQMTPENEHFLAELLLWSSPVVVVALAIALAYFYR